MRQVIVYTKNNCPECEKLKFNLGYLPKEVMEDFTIEYRNIDESETHANDFIVLGYSSVPLTFVEDEENPVVGFNMGELQRAFGI